MVTSPTTFSEIPMAVWEGFKEAIGIGVQGTTEALEQLPKSLTAPIEVVKGASLATIAVGGVLLYLLLKDR